MFLICFSFFWGGRRGEEGIGGGGARFHGIGRIKKDEVENRGEKTGDADFS